jgi:Replication initiator protein A
MPRPDRMIAATENASGRDEMNLAELPIALLSSREPDECGPLVFETRHGKLTVTCPSGPRARGNGLPTAADTDVLIGLLQLTKRANDFTDPTVSFSRYELLRIIRWPDEGKSYRRLKESLKRWVKVTLEYEGCWFDNRDRIRCDNTVNILSEAHVYERFGRDKAPRGRDGVPASRICWAPTFFQSCRANYLKRLDLDVYFALGSPTTKQIYRFLDKRFHKKPSDPAGEPCLTRTFDLKELAFGHVGMSANYTIPRIKEKLAPCLKELEEIGFIEPATKEGRYTKTGHGKWDITFRRKAREQEALPPPDPTPSLAQDLIDRGVTPVTAHELAAGFPAGSIAEKVEVFDWLMARRDRRASKNPPGYLADSIRGDYKPPRGFKGRTEAEAERLVEALAEREEEARKAREREEDARLKAEIAAADGYLERLAPERRAELEREAIANAPEGLNPRFFLKQIVRDHVMAILGAGVDPPASPGRT